VAAKGPVQSANAARQICHAHLFVGAEMSGRDTLYWNIVDIIPEYCQYLLNM
jgi:hypothetical protein